MNEQRSVAVVVGRFQTPNLHAGHRYLIDTAQSDGRKLLIAIGVSGGMPSRRDPMDFDTVAAMIAEAYPEATIVPIMDCCSVKSWSNDLDQLIERSFPDHTVTLFGSRDSFLALYDGKHYCQEIQPQQQICATEIRQAVSATIINSAEFRAGVIYASRQSFPTSFQAVDIVIKHSLENKVIVGRKAGEDKWRFPGGFVDPTDLSLEQAAKREAREEVGDIELGGVEYIRSMRINDYRYRSSEHKVMTALFSATYVYGRIQAGDDLEEVRWQDLDGLVNCLMDAHQPLAEVYLQTIANQKQKGKTP